MRLLLQKYNYRFADFPNSEDWITDEVYLQKLNLFVGKNAAGKSRIATAPIAFAEMVTQKIYIYRG
jgi:predicted ATPase